MTKVQPQGSKPLGRPPDDVILDSTAALTNFFEEIGRELEPRELSRLLGELLSMLQHKSSTFTELQRVMREGRLRSEIGLPHAVFAPAAERLVQSLMGQIDLHALYEDGEQFPYEFHGLVGGLDIVAHRKCRSPSRYASGVGGYTAKMTPPTIDISLPDRYDMLARKAVGQLSQIISPVDAALERIDMLHADMRASSRGTFLIIRGDSGTGKSTFIHTIGLFRDDVETVSFSKERDIAEVLESLGSTKCQLRIVVFEGREALTDVSKELLEKSIHAINSFVRTSAGERTIVAWPANRDDLAANLASLASEIGAEALTGLDEPVFRFQGPTKAAFIPIVNKTLALLNQGETLHDLGISDGRATQLVEESPTIGIFLAKVRRDLLSNQRQLASLTKKEICRIWIVVLAGNEPEGDIDALTRGTMYSADIDRMLSVTNANIVKDLKEFPEKLGMLGTYLDARVLHVPVLAALAAVRTYASENLRVMMKSAGMLAAPEKDAKERLADTNLVASFNNTPIGARKVGGKVGPNSVAAFEKLTNIASTNDVELNKAIAACLIDLGVVSGCAYEQDFGIGMSRRTDIVATSGSGTIRLEMMWRKKTGRAEIANYVLTKLFNYGKAIGYLSNTKSDA